MDRFAKAIRNVLVRFADRGMESVEIQEIWIESSIPQDLIEELIRGGKVEIPEGIKEIKKGKSVVWRRKGR